MSKNHRRTICFVLGMMLVCWGGWLQVPRGWTKDGAPIPARLLQIKEHPQPESTRMILTLSQPVVPRVFPLSDPGRLVIDLSPCTLALTQTPELSDPLFKGWRYAQFKKNTVRIVLPALAQTPYKLSREGAEAFRLLLDFPRKEKPLGPPISSPVKPDSPKVQSLTEFKTEQALAERMKPLPAQAQRITFDFYNADLHNVFRVIGEVGRVNIIVGDDVKGKVTMSFREHPWDQALEILTANFNLHQERFGNNILLSSSENYLKKLQAQIKEEMDKEKLKQEKAKTKREERKNDEFKEKFTKKYQIRYVDVQYVYEQIKAHYGLEKKTRSASGMDSGRGPSFEKSEETTSKAMVIPGSETTITPILHTNILMIRGTQEETIYMDELVDSFDQPVSQVMIEARIVEVDANFTRDMGLRWGGSYAYGNPSAPFGGTIRGGDAGATANNTNNYAVNLPLTSIIPPFGGLGFSFASAAFNLDVRLQAMEQQGRGKTISSPKILTIFGKEAEITQGTEIPVTTRDQNNSFSTIYKDAALKLTVTPYIAGTRKMRIDLTISNDAPDLVKADSLGNPFINKKKAKTNMIVNDGETIVIGGIISKKEGSTENRVPGLGDIPVLGWLFKTRNRSYQDTELLIFLTPRFVQASDVGRLTSER